jgi:mRNA-degrading endonuclease RelE of RelBE toxin-antitoxin system
MRKFKLLNIRNERQFKAFTGLAYKEFEILLAEFTNCLKLNQQMRYKKNRLNRKRKPGGGRKGTLSTPELKLFFILFYLKNYPTFDVLGCLFDISPAKAEENIIKLMPILKQAEKRLHVLPRRHFKPASNNKQDNENIDKIIIDATERPYHRPHHDRKQKHYFSGKRRYHTLKNTVIADVKNGIPVVGPTAVGSRHDYALLKDELNPNQPGLSSVEVYVDLAYQGIKDRYPAFHKIHIPYKKPRKSKDHPNPTLTPQQKKENRAISRIRVIVENLIGDMKIFQILSIKFRNRIKNFGDQVILMVAGLCNLKNHYVVQ